MRRNRGTQVKRTVFKGPTSLAAHRSILLLQIREIPYYAEIDGNSNHVGICDPVRPNAFSLCRRIQRGRELWALGVYCRAW